jgi:8-hydroxy-5-deazaflavin:NADPH oxidoreductase
MRIAIIGAGHVGPAIARNLSASGHNVAVGTRDVRGAAAAAAREALGDVPVLEIGAALDGAEAVVLAVPGAAMDDLIAAHGAALDGKIVMDAANRIGESLSHQGEMNSVATLVAAAPSAAVYRAFNSLGWENYADPVIDGVRADLLYAGPASRREEAEELIAGAGLRPVYVGDLDKVGLVDSLAALWGSLAYGQGLGRRLFFKVVTPGQAGAGE